MVLCRYKGSLCRDMVLKLQAVAWSRHSIFMSRQRFPCRDRDGHDKRSGIVTGLALGRDFML